MPISVTPVQVSCVILVDKRGWLLLQERDNHTPIDPDKWGLVGGHVELGEDFETAVYRELAEETGISWTSGLELWFEGPFTRGRGEVRDFNVWCGATTLGNADIVLGEGRQIVFVDPRAIPALDLSESARRFVLGFLESRQYAELVEAMPESPGSGRSGEDSQVVSVSGRARFATD